MTLLTKININSKESIEYADIEIQNYINKNPKYSGLIIVDQFNRIHINNYDKFIPHNFMNNIIFISPNSFQQNHRILSNDIRRYVSSIINDKQNLMTIGGESYIYGLVNKIPYINHLTNSIYIYNDSLLNSQYYNSNISNNYVNYNKINNIIYNHTILINLSTLNSNLLNVLNSSNAEEIIIINCNMNDFWRKIKLLYNYKITSRKQFVCDKLKYFITVTNFKNKLLFYKVDL